MTKQLVAFAVVGLAAVTLYVDSSRTSARKNDGDTGKVKNAYQNPRTAETAYAENFRRFRIEVETKIKVNGNAIDRFESTLARSTVLMNSRYASALANVKTMNFNLIEKVQDYKEEGKFNWVGFRDGLNKEIDKVESAIKELSAEMDDRALSPL